jgi:SNF2 family DNA or RNA helicase
VIPRLLQGAPDVNQLVAKTQEYKAKGQQLDLLLLKAETYSHFIRENQERSKQKLEQGSHFSAIEEDNDEEDENDANNSSKKRKKAGGKGKGKTSKSAKGATGVPLPSSTEQDPNDTFRVTKTLVGGSLMSYQKEGLKWLLSLWENGLSGILADEM